MTEQTKRLRKALDGCAEGGISPTPDPWAEIESRLQAHAAHTNTSRRFLPKTRAGLILAAALVVLFGMGAYAATDWVYENFRYALPGARGPDYGEQLGLVQTAHGVRVSLEWAYADQRNVVVGLNLEDLEGDRQVNGHPAEIGAGGVLTGEGGTDFDYRDGQASTTGNMKPLTEMPNVDVFAPKEPIEPGSHEFRLKVPIVAQALPMTKLSRSEPVGEPFVFHFEIPVRPVPVIEANQTVEANGVALTLERIIDSPARAEAKICYDSPDTDYDWVLFGKGFAYSNSGYGGGPDIGEKRACTTMLLPASPNGGSSTVTVERLWGDPGCPPGDNNGCSIPQSRIKKLEGPWTFEVAAPER